MPKAQPILSRKNARRLLKQLYENAMTDNQKKLAARNLTMALLMLDSKLRISEVTNLLAGDLFTQGRPRDTLHVFRGVRKQGRERVVSLAENVRWGVELMSRFWWTPDANKPGTMAFYTRSPCDRMTKRQFQRIIKEAAIEAFGYPITPNTLRQI